MDSSVFHSNPSIVFSSNHEENLDENREVSQNDFTAIPFNFFFLTRQLTFFFSFQTIFSKFTQIIYFFSFIILLNQTNVIYIYLTLFYFFILPTKFTWWKIKIFSIIPLFYHFNQINIISTKLKHD